MAEVGAAFISLIPSARGFSSATERQIAPQLEKSGKRIGLGFGKALFGAAAAVAATAGIGRLFSDSIGEAREAQKVSALTNQVIKTTGGVANVTAKHVDRLSNAISRKAGIDDEVVATGENVLLTFKFIRNEVGLGNKIFDRATKAAVDLSATPLFNGNVAGASKQLGKALNDPVKGVTALGRAGVTFTKTQQDEIKALVASGQILKAQKIVLREVESQVGGAAAATATSGDKMQVAWKNLEEQIGTALLPVIEKIQTFLTGKVIPAVSQFFTEMQSGTGTGGQVADILGRVGKVLGTVFGFLAKHKETVVTFVAVLGGMTIAFAALNAVMAINPISLVIIAIAALVTGLILAYKHSETFRTIVDGAFRAVAAAASFMWNNVIKPIFRFWLNTWFTVIGAMVNGAAKAFGWVPGIGGKLKAAAAKFNSFRDSVNNALDGIHPVKDIAIKIHANNQVLQRGPGGLPLFHTEGAGATGAIVRRPTVALIGEAGPEALIPLNKTAGNSPLPTGGGAQFNVEAVYAQDVNDFLTQMQARSRRSGLDGVRR